VTDVVEAVWRIESARVIAALARLVGDIGVAEELAQDAFVVALEKWPVAGVPDEPGPWLMATAKHRAIDHLRRRGTLQRKLALLDHDVVVAEPDLDDHIEDDLLRLVFTACHPVLTVESQVALVLRVLGGLSTDEIARAFLTTDATMSQRILRAKRTLAERGVRFELPSPAELPSRSAAVLGVVYLIFNEGYAATSGEDWIRPALCEEALRLGRLVAALLPGSAEALGLSALMELQASRIGARTGPSGEPVLLLDQDRRSWDRLLIRRGLSTLYRAEALGTLGPYGLQAAIAACHARAVTAAHTDWDRIAALYLVLSHVSPSPVVTLNRAVAVGMAGDPSGGLALVDSVSLPRYPFWFAARGELLSRLGRDEEARRAFAQAASLTRSEPERRLFLARAGRLSSGPSSGAVTAG
jgi:RNA polymerase sigma factor (sigma-70 family)